MEQKELTWGDVRRDRLCISKSLIPFKLAKQKTFLFVHGTGVNLYNLCAADIKDLLEFDQGEEGDTQVYLQNIPNRYGASCMVCNAEMRDLLDGKKLPIDAGTGAKILERCIHK